VTNLKQAFEFAKMHARSVYPEESVGFVVEGRYVPVKNIAADPSAHREEGCFCRLCTFRVSASDTSRFLTIADMILHSHPDGPSAPSKRDMISQIESGVPWGIISLDDERISDPVLWGDQLAIKPLLGRQFMHGISDCYSLIRDIFKTGKDELAATGITKEWPFDPIVLREVPRNDAWWEGDDDLYGLLPPSHGWSRVNSSDVRPGDTFLIKVRSKKFNHAGSLIGSNLIMHHLPGRMSRREPAGLWARQAGQWLRYKGEV
jgi:proteasome lid subunit RPN8/RPN11